MESLNSYYQRKYLLDWTLIAVWMISSVILTFSFYHQYIEKFEPCTLCKWQQFVYFLIFAISPIGLISRLNLSVRNAFKLHFFDGFTLIYLSYSCPIWVAS